MVSNLMRRRAPWLVMVAALLLSVTPFSTLADHHKATRTPVTFTFTFVEDVSGEEWSDEAGIFHFRSVAIQEVSGDISGTATINFSGEFEPVGECTEESCPAYFSFRAQAEITGEDGGWTGTYAASGSDVPGDEFYGEMLVLKGTGGNAGKSIVASLVEETEDSATFEGVLVSQGAANMGLNTSVRLCADPETFTFTGGFLSTGAIEGHGGASIEPIVAGGPWTHTYAVAGTFTLTDEHGSVTIAFAGGAQDNYTPSFEASHFWGHFVVLEGTGAYAELYANGRIIGTAGGPSPTCESGFGVNASLIGEARFN
ncbi:hypothetical protein BH23CHL2_BH23CHL2_07730 [soil metagenome]